MHAFCNPHAQQWFSSSQSCPICHRTVQVIKKQLGPGELIGLPPNKVLESAAIALKFWATQKETEATRIRETAAARECIFKEKMKQAEDYVQRLNKAYNEMKTRCKDLMTQQQTWKAEKASRARHESFTPALFEPPSNHKSRSFGDFGSPWPFT